MAMCEKKTAMISKRLYVTIAMPCPMVAALHQLQEDLGSIAKLEKGGNVCIASKFSLA